MAKTIDGTTQDVIDLAKQFFLKLVESPQWANNLPAASAEARRRAEAFLNPSTGAPATDPHAELDNGYAPNFPPEYHINRMSRYMPHPNGRRGELVERPDLDAALKDCRAARRMSAAEKRHDLQMHIVAKEEERKKLEEQAKRDEVRREEIRQRKLEKAMSTVDMGEDG